MNLDQISNREIEKCESTNLLVKEMGRDPKFPHGTWLASRIQTLGRGSKGRGWVSPEGNIHLSVLIREIPRKHFLVLPIIAGLEVCRELEKLSSEIRLKWPNDIVVRQGREVKKLAGVLCEGEFGVERSFVVVGVGLNCRLSPNVEGRRTICMHDLVDSGVDRDAIRESIYKNLIRSLTHLDDDIVAKLLKEYEARLVFSPGDWIEWEDQSNRIYEGRFVGMSGDGQLIVSTDGKNEIRLMNEEIQVRT